MATILLKSLIGKAVGLKDRYDNQLSYIIHFVESIDYKNFSLVTYDPDYNNDNINNKHYSDTQDIPINFTLKSKILPSIITAKPLSGTLIFYIFEYTFNMLISFKCSRA